MGALGLIRDAVAYWLVMHLPGGWRGGIWARIESALLPWAGRWGYRDMPDARPEVWP